jgi:hypothetical protein
LPSVAVELVLISRDRLSAASQCIIAESYVFLQPGVHGEYENILAESRGYVVEFVIRFVYIDVRKVRTYCTSFRFVSMSWARITIKKKKCRAW